MPMFLAGDVCIGKNKENDLLFIKNWNNTLTQGDTGVFFGETVYRGTSEAYLLNFFSSLKGRKQVMESLKNKTNYNWQNITNRETLYLNLFLKGTIFNEEETIVVPCDKRSFNRLIKKFICAVPRSISNMKEIYENNSLSISVEDWDFNPICCKQLPQIIEGQIIFKRMEKKV